jgi:hypothetical protein
MGDAHRRAGDRSETDLFNVAYVGDGDEDCRYAVAPERAMAESSVPR